MTTYQGRFLDPRPDDTEVYPYRRVWGSLIVENVILFGAAAVVFVFANLLHIQLPAVFASGLNVTFPFLPIALWLIFSVWRERAVREPRRNLFVVLILAALAANAIALPLINDVLQPERWLPLENPINRIIGYTFSVGIVQETTKYIILRYSAWNSLLRTRTDAVAYSVAAALGYATVVNVQFLLSNPSALPDVVAVHVAQNVAVSVAGSLFVSLGLAETRFDHPTPFFMMITVALSSLIVGIAQSALSGLVNAPFSIHGSFARPLLGFGFAVAVFAISVLITVFLYSAAERRELERARSEDDR